MGKQEESQGDQAINNQGRARRSRTRSISDVRDMFVDQTPTADAAQQQTTNKVNADPQTTTTSRGNGK